MQAGAIVFERYAVEAELPRQGGLRRFAGHDQVSGDAVELWTPTGTAWLRPGSEVRWEQAWTRAGSTALAQRRVDGRPVAVTPPTLADGSITLELDDDAILGIAATLGPAILDNEGPLGGRFGPHDLSWSPEGRPSLRPSGVVPEHSLARPDRFSAPEGTPTDPLYGLGVWLFERRCGGQPAQGRTATQLRTAQARPRRAMDLGVDVAPAVDDLLAGLLSLDQAKRRSVISTLATPESEVRVDPALLALPEESAALAPTRAPAPPSASRDLALPPWVVVTDAGALTGGGRKRLAALATLNMSGLEAAVTAGARIAVAGGDSEGAAQARALALAPTGVDLAVEPSSARWQPIAALLGATLALVVVLIGVGLLGVLTVVVPLVAVILAALVGVGGGAAAWTLWRREATRVASLRRHWGPLNQGASAEDTVLAELVDSRRAVLGSELSAPAQRDLLEVIDSLEARYNAAPDDLSGVSELREALDTVRQACVAQTDTPTVEEVAERARLAAAGRRELDGL